MFCWSRSKGCPESCTMYEVILLSFFIACTSGGTRRRHVYYGRQRGGAGTQNAFQVNSSAKSTKITHLVNINILTWQNSWWKHEISEKRGKMRREHLGSIPHWLKRYHLWSHWLKHACVIKGVKHWLESFAWARTCVSLMLQSYITGCVFPLIRLLVYHVILCFLLCTLQIGTPEWCDVVDESQNQSDRESLSGAHSLSARLVLWPRDCTFGKHKGSFVFCSLVD